ncbi:hypothetical protein [Paenibacillus turicensis]|nr:hypothetical protein [Paenibacillus turicensis]
MNTIVREGSYEGRMKKYIAECLDIVSPLIGQTGSDTQRLTVITTFTEKVDVLYDNLLTLQQIEENRCANSGDQNSNKIINDTI